MIDETAGKIYANEQTPSETGFEHPGFYPGWLRRVQLFADHLAQRLF